MKRPLLLLLRLLLLLTLGLGSVCGGAQDTSTDEGYCAADGAACSGGGASFTAGGVLNPQPVEDRHGEADHRQLLRLRRPILIRQDAVVRQWPASQSWTPQRLSQVLPILPVYYHSSKSIFATFHDDKPLEPWVVGESWSDYNQRRNLSTSELFGALRQQPPVPLKWQYVDGKNVSTASGPWAYFSASLEKIRPLWSDVIADSSPHSAMWISEPPVLPQRNLWLGRAGLVTAMHHDLLWNVFSQLHGCKLITLLPPDAPMYLYPCQHPHYGHAQVDLFSPTLQHDLARLYPDMQAAAPLAAYEARVCAGDSLLIPPLWYHQVITLSDSISLNAWSSAPEYDLMDEVYAEPLPFEAHWSRARMMASVAEYFDVLLHTALQSTLPAEAHYVAKTRWHPLLAAGRLKLDVVLDGLLENACRTEAEVMQRRAELPTLARIRERAEQVGAVLQGIEVPSIRRIMAHNYLEHVTALVSSPGAVPSALQRCFGANVDSLLKKRVME